MPSMIHRRSAAHASAGTRTLSTPDWRLGAGQPVTARAFALRILPLLVLAAALLTQRPAHAEDAVVQATPLATPPMSAPDGMGHLHADDASPASPATAEAAQADQDGPAEVMDPHHGHGMGMHPHHGMQMDAHNGVSDDGDSCERMQAAHGGMAHGHGMMHGHGTGEDDDAVLLAVAAPQPPAWLADLALTETQEDRIFDILHEVAPAQRKAQRTVTRTLALLHHAGMATDYNEGETRRIADQHGAAVAELARLAARTERRILDALTAEQRRDAAHRAAHQE